MNTDINNGENHVAICDLSAAAIKKGCWNVIIPTPKKINASAAMNQILARRLSLLFPVMLFNEVVDVIVVIIFPLFHFNYTNS